MTGLAVLRHLSTTVDYLPHVEEVRRINRFIGGFGLPHHIVRQAGVTVDAWRSAVEAMKTDADAELPK